VDQLAAADRRSLRGKVVLVDFWTYSCINCLRTLPYVRAWAEKYKDAGLVVVGVHSPEFAFEKLLGQRAQGHEGPGHRLPGGGRQQLRDLARLRQPGLAGVLLHRCAGAHPPSPVRRGRYDKAEQVIQQLLAEAGQATCRASWCAEGPGHAGRAGALLAMSGETYLGYERAHNFASPGGLASDRAHVYQARRVAAHEPVGAGRRMDGRAASAPC
jgi:thiol-disulfide isomerase/thioredoxin